MVHAHILDPSLASLTDWRSVATFIDHSLVLKPETTREEVIRLCREAAHYGFANVFVNPALVAIAVRELHGTKVGVGTTVGFPLGAYLTTVKRFEVAEVLRLGAAELDMVMNIGALKSSLCDLVEADIRGVAEIAHQGGAILKVILEMPLLSREEKILACQLCVAAGADFVKTATGFFGGATLEDVALMHSVVGDRARVKAAGGVRTAKDLAVMVQAGADRIGTSSGVSIMRELGAPEPSSSPIR
jgi:deoxyribose-phosphate aldolase